MTTGVTVHCDNLVHVYGLPGAEVTALRGIDLDVVDGETVALLGPSGSGKSTLLWLLAGLMRPTAGTLEVCGRRIRELSAGATTELRRREVGVVLQNPGRNLLPYATALGNVAFAQSRSRESRATRRRGALDLLDTLGLRAVAKSKAGMLSGGEQQRLALAVALANRPRLLLADEPTSQVGRDAAAGIVELIRTVSADLGTTVVAVTHDPDVAAAFDRTVTIRDGQVGSEGRAGEDYVVVGRDGTIHLPPEALALLPPGSLVRTVHTDDAITLTPVDPHPGDDA